jgi:hypothetical protein
MTSLLKRCQNWLAALGTVALLAACSGQDSNVQEPVPPAAVAPSFTLQPTDTQATVGSEARFTANAQGSAIAWAWQRSTDAGTTWAGIANASTATLTLPAVTLADNNTRLRAVATSGGLQTFSSAATLTVVAQVTAPAISVQLAPAQAVAGSSVTLAITATGTALQYQWQSSRDGNNWADLAGASAATLQLQNLALDANGTLYRVVVRNSAGSVNSSAVTLSVTAPLATPAFTLQPQAASVTPPSAATFMVAVTGQPAPTLQWQRSSNAGASYSDIVGATAASYTLPSTTLADSGTLFRVQASNSAGSATSTAATLTVATAPVLPAIGTQPLDVSVVSGQTATWSVAATGVPAPTLQWQLSTDGGTSFANINGATGSNYSLVTAVADNGKRVRVQASNSQGTTTSRAAVLTVAAPANVLAGRGWLAGERVNRTSDFLLEQTGSSQLPTVSIIDKVGRVHVLYASSTSSGLEVLVSTSLPRAPGVQPTLNTPVVVSNRPALYLPDGLWQAANGNATATWRQLVPCTADPTENCFQNWQATYNAVAETWSAGTTISDQELAVLKGISNDVGDRIALVSGVNSNSPTGLGLGWRQAGRSNIETLAFGPGDLIGDLFTLSAKIALANDGAVVLAYVRVGTDGAANLIVRRGSIRTGMLGSEEALDSRSAPATINGFWSNTAGQVVLMWYQDNGTRITQYASTLSSSTGAWTTTDLGPWSATAAPVLGTLTSGGDLFAYTSKSTCRTLRRINGTWISATALPSALCATSTQWAMDGNGNLLVVNALDGRWASFDASTQSFVESFVNATPTTGPGFVLGTRWTSLSGTLLLSDTGIGAFVSVNSFDALPTASAPNGDSRGTTVKNIWNIYFK